MLIVNLGILQNETFSGNDSLLLKLSTETASLVKIFQLCFVAIKMIIVDVKERL